MKTKKYFGTDGIRGQVGKWPIMPEFIMRLGMCAGKVLMRRSTCTQTRPTVLIGKDTRISGYMLEAALEAGFAAAGMDILLAGPVPTPAIAYLTRTLRLCAGVVISASHNLFEDNGIKFFSGEGTKLSDQLETEIEAMLDKPMTCVSSAHLGKARRLDDTAGRYIEFCKSTFPDHLHLRGIKIIVDTAHGAAYHIAPHVFHELGAEVVSIGYQPNGVNINAGYGATAPQALVEAVVSERADVGIALDGDADRVVMVDAKGRIYDGDALLYIIIKDRLAHDRATVKGVVGTQMTNMGLEMALQQQSIPFIRANVGDRYVLEALQKQGWHLGGENSGHLLCLDKHTTGDGIISALQVLAAIKRTGVSMAALVADMTCYTQTLMNVKIPPQFHWEAHPQLLAEKQQVEKELGTSGRVLIRTSGTEPLLRIMVEAVAPEIATKMARRIVEKMKN